MKAVTNMLSWLIIISIIASVTSDEQTIQQEDLHSRIIGGTDVEITQYPYQVSVHDNGVFCCGGSIINKDFILTAGHCVNKNLMPINYKIRAGSTYTNIGGSLHAVSNVILHSNFSNGKIMDNDIALLKVHPPFVFDQTRQPINLHTNIDGITSGTLAVITGFGKIGSNGPVSNRLQAVEIPVMSWITCRQQYQKLGMEVKRNFICAGINEGQKDSCQGDSGGPLAINGRLVGIVSWGKRCGSPGIPGVYTNVGHYVQWITNQVNN